MVDLDREMLNVAIVNFNQVCEKFNESLKEIFDQFCMGWEDVAEALANMFRSLTEAEQTVKKHGYSRKPRPPFNLMKAYTYVAQNKKNLPYQHRNF